MQIIVQNTLVHYEITGKGKVVLLVHGWADRLETFRSLNADLGKNYQLISLDLPGFGKTEAPQAVWNLDDYAQFVADFLKKIGHDTNLYGIIGHSNGGAVAIRGIAEGSFAPNKLVLLASSGVRDTEVTRRFVIKLIAKIGKVMTFWLPRKTKKILQKKLYGTVGSDMLVSPQLQETFKKTVRQDIQADAARIDLPTLLIYGDQDKATPINTIGKILNGLIKNSRLKTISGADHFVHKAEPLLVSRYIKEFLN